jgi:hypothetical protein
MLLNFLAANWPEFSRDISRQAADAFFQYPHIVAGAVSIGLSAFAVGFFWLARGAAHASSRAAIAMRAQQLKRTRDHHARILLTPIKGFGAGALRQEIAEGIERRFGVFAFQAPAQVEMFPVALETIPIGAEAERGRKVAIEALDLLEMAAGDVIVWGRRSLNGKVQLRLLAAPSFGRLPEAHEITFQWRHGEALGEIDDVIAYACARRARPVLNRPQDYKPEKLQLIVDALDRIVNRPPAGLGEGALMELLDDYARGALSLGERGGHVSWLERSLEARERFVQHIDRQGDPGAWGAAQQEVGRALAALGERDADRAKLEDAAKRLRMSLDSLRATDTLQAAEVAMRALARVEQTLAQRKKVGLRWPA